MKTTLTLMLLGLFCLARLQAEASYEEFVRVEKAILGVDRPLTLKQFLARLRIIDKWDRRLEQKQLIGYETSFNSMGRKYDMPGAIVIEDAYFAGQLGDEKEEAEVSFVVTKVVVCAHGDCHVYQWEKGKFSKVRIFERVKVSSEDE